MSGRRSPTAAYGAAATLCAGAPTLAFDLQLTDEFIDAVAARVLDVLGAEHQQYHQQDWITGAEDAAAHLGCGKHRVYRLVHEGRLPHYKDGGRLVFSRAELDQWRRNGGRR